MYKITPHIIAIITLGNSFFFNNNSTYQIHCSTQITQNPIYIIPKIRKQSQWQSQLQ